MNVDPKPILHLLGETAAIRRGKMLLEIHFKHQLKISNFHDTRERKLQALEEQKSRYDSAPSCEFFLDGTLVGIVIGKRGENLKRLEKEYNVDIHITDPDPAKKDAKHKVRVYGETKEAVTNACKE